MKNMKEEKCYVSCGGESYMRVKRVQGQVCLESSGVQIKEGDNDWDWDMRDTWNAAIEGAEASIVAFATVWPGRLEDSSFTEAIETALGAIENKF